MSSKIFVVIVTLCAYCSTQNPTDITTSAESTTIGSPVTTITQNSIGNTTVTEISTNTTEPSPTTTPFTETIVTATIPGNTTSEPGQCSNIANGVSVPFYNRWSYLLAILNNFQIDVSVKLIGLFSKVLAECNPRDTRLVRNLRILLGLVEGDLLAAAKSAEDDLTDLIGTENVNISLAMKLVLSGKTSSDKGLASLLIATDVNVTVPSRGAADVVMTAFLSLRRTILRGESNETIMAVFSEHKFFQQILKLSFAFSDQVEVHVDCNVIYYAVTFGFLNNTDRSKVAVDRYRALRRQHSAFRPKSNEKHRKLKALEKLAKSHEKLLKSQVKRLEHNAVKTFRKHQEKSKSKGHRKNYKNQYKHKKHHMNQKNQKN